MVASEYMTPKIALSLNDMRKWMILQYVSNLIVHLTYKDGLQLTNYVPNVISELLIYPEKQCSKWWLGCQPTSANLTHCIPEYNTKSTVLFNYCCSYGSDSSWGMGASEWGVSYQCLGSRKPQTRLFISMNG